jgi:hypothetical protein
MLEKGESGQVVADSGLSRRLIDAAHRHVKSAETLADDDPDLAYAADRASTASAHKLTVIKGRGPDADLGPHLA